MKYFIVIFIFLLILAAVASFLLLRQKTEKVQITFQTSCAIQFAFQNSIPALTFIPDLKTYNLDELISEMNKALYPITVTFSGQMVVIMSPHPFGVTDRQYTAQDGILNGKYVGARYGEAKRFLAHLNISTPIFYGEPNFTFLTFLKSGFLIGKIGNTQIPAIPQILNITNQTLVSNGDFIGIYLKDLTTPPNNVENWDFANTSYTFYNLAPDSYSAYISAIGTYDETDLSNSFTFTVSEYDTNQSYDLLQNATLVPFNIINRNTETKVLNLPSLSIQDPNLSRTTQIKEVLLMYYAEFNSYNSPSDSRVYTQDTVLDYTYWKFVQSVIPQKLAFASSNEFKTNLGGVPLSYTMNTYTDQNLIRQLFGSFSGGSFTDNIDFKKNMSLFFFCGYGGIQLQSNSSVPAISSFSINYVT